MADEPFLLLAERYESGGRNIPSELDPIHGGQGYLQILKSNWTKLAPQAGIDLKQYPTPISAPRDLQFKVGALLPESAWTRTNPALARAVGVFPHGEGYDPSIGATRLNVAKERPDEPGPTPLDNLLLLAASKGAPPQEPSALDKLLDSFGGEPAPSASAMPLASRLPVETSAPAPIGTASSSGSALDRLLASFSPIGSAQAAESSSSNLIPPIPTAAAARSSGGEAAPGRGGIAAPAPASAGVPAVTPGPPIATGQAPEPFRHLGIEPATVKQAASRIPEVAQSLASDFKEYLDRSREGLVEAGKALGGAFDDAANRYLQSEQNLLAGKMSREDLAGLAVEHIAGGAPGGALSAGLRLPERLGQAVADIKRDTGIKIAPMAQGGAAGQAIAKDFANAERSARYMHGYFDDKLRKFSFDDQAKMWEAGDAASVTAQQTGDLALAEKHLDVLTPEQKAVMLEMDRYGADLWERGRAVGLVQGDAARLPFYMTRAILNIGADGSALRIGAEEAASPLDMLGINLRTRGGFGRSYMTAAETEAAAKARFGPQAEIVRNVRALPWAMERLERAIAGRRLVNDIEEIGKALGKPATAPGAQPGFFTLPHPALQTYRPRFVTDPAGKVVPLRDLNGDIVFDKTPIYVSREMEGPLRSVLIGADNATYRAAMALKGGVMSLVMNSPLIHNAVEWGRALPALPGKVLSFRVYSDGRRFMEDPAKMRQAIADGLVPIGHRGYGQDITGIAEAPNLKPGRSITSQVIGGPVELVAPKAGQDIKRAIDAAGDFWHNKLLWDQVAKLQAGLYTNLRADMLKKGVEPAVAGKIAAHFANRYAGALPREAMGEMARKILNFAFFSRSFTFGNLGVLKDMVTGLPRDVQAQIGRDLSAIERSAAKSLARRKAIGIFAMDVALFYVGNALLQTGLSMLRGDETLGEVGRGYARRLDDLIAKTKEAPLDLLSPFDDLLTLSPLGENEPGKENRVLIGHADDGTAIYGRLPTGKIGEEFTGWIQQPIQQLKNKEGTVIRPVLNVLANDRGFGQKVYDVNATGMKGIAENVGRIAWEFVRNQIPQLQLEAAYKAITGKDRSWLTIGQAVSPFFGFSISKGAPGGETVGELYHARQMAHDEQQRAMGDVDDMIRAGKINEAVQTMRGLGMNPALIRWRVRVIQNPSARLSRQQIRNFELYATPLQKKRMERRLEKQRAIPQPTGEVRDWLTGQ